MEDKSLGYWQVSKIQKRLFFDNHDNASFCPYIVANTFICSCLSKVCFIRKRNLISSLRGVKRNDGLQLLDCRSRCFSVKDKAPTSVIVFLPSSGNAVNFNFATLNYYDP